MPMVTAPPRADRIEIVERKDWHRGDETNGLGPVAIPFARFALGIINRNEHRLFSRGSFAAFSRNDLRLS